MQAAVPKKAIWSGAEQQHMKALVVCQAPSTAASAEHIAPEDSRIGQHGDAITGHPWRAPQGRLREDCCVVHITRGGLQEHLNLLHGLGTEFQQLPHHLQGRHRCFCCVCGAAAAPACAAQAVTSAAGQQKHWHLPWANLAQNAQTSVWQVPQMLSVLLDLLHC